MFMMLCKTNIYKELHVAYIRVREEIITLGEHLGRIDNEIFISGVGDISLDYFLEKFPTIMEIIKRIVCDLNKNRDMKSISAICTNIESEYLDLFYPEEFNLFLDKNYCCRKRIDNEFPLFEYGGNNFIPECKYCKFCTIQNI